MKTKLVYTKDYVLLLYLDNSNLRQNELIYTTNSISKFTGHFDPNNLPYRILAYRKLNSEISNLDLPLLPNYEEEVDLNDTVSKIIYGFEGYKNVREYKIGYREGFFRGVKIIQELSQDNLFTLDDIKEAFEAGRSYGEFDYRVRTNEPLDKEDYIQQLKQSRLPKEFVPYNNQLLGPKEISNIGNFHTINGLMVKDTPQGKQVVGTYKF